MMPNNNLSDAYDVVVIGGGATGLSGALVLARSRRSVLVIDAGEPRNAPASSIHGFLSQDGTPPKVLLAKGRSEVESYGGQLLNGRVRCVAKESDSFSVTLDDERKISARRLLVTTGLVDELPDVAGLRERWGRDVVHCPYCHGWEVRDQAVGILASGSTAVHSALLFRQLTADVVLFSHTGPGITDEQADQLARRQVRVVDGRVARVEVVDDRLVGVRLADDTFVACEALVVGPRMVASSDVLAGLGLRREEHPMGLGEFIPADATGQTEVAGVWVGGNVKNLAANVIVAAAEGATAAAAINADLVAEDALRGRAV